MIWIGRYVLMPDHLHVFVSAEGNAALSRWIGSLKKHLTAWRRQAGLEGPFWQDGFSDHLLRHGESYAEKWRYVCQNPVRKGLTKSAEEWPYAGEIHALSWD